MGEDRSTKKDARIKLVEAFEDSPHFITITPFLISEISTHLADWYLLNKVIKSGHSYREFNLERKNHDLSEVEKNNINDILEKLTTKDFVATFVIDEIKKPDLEILFILTGNNVSFYDAIHVMTAKSIGCEYFVTSDGEIRKRTQLMVNKKLIDSNLKIASPSGFLKMIIKDRNNKI